MAINIGRREFIVTLGSAAAWPLAARAQQAAKLTSIGQASALRAVTTVRCLRFAGTVVVALAISLMLMAAPAFAQIKWTLPSAYPADNFHSQNLEAFAKDLAEATGGKLSIKVYPNASLLPVSVIKRAVQMGRMQIGETLISLHDNEDPIFGIDVVPFLATSYDEARKLWEASKPLVERKLATGLINAFMTSGATGYDVKAWESMGYFYDTQAWIPKNVTIVNRAAFGQLDKSTQETMLKVAAAAEARGWWRSQDKTKWYTEQLAAHGMKVLPPSRALKTELQQMGERLTGEWLMRAGADGQAVIEAYRKQTK